MRMRWWTSGFASLLIFTAADRAQINSPSVLVPRDAIAAIVDALRSHDVVGLSAGEGHGDLRGEAFVLALIRDTRFAEEAVDVVVEAGNARYQGVMDRYTRGEHVDAAALRRVWDDSTQAQLLSAAGEIPLIYRTIREINAVQPAHRRIRAVLPDPPIEWEHVATKDDYRKWLEQRDSYGAEAVRREVLDKRRRALLIFGGGHLQRRNQLSNYQMDHPLAHTVISLLEQGGAQTFVVKTAEGSLQDGMQTWPVPSLAFVRGTTLGSAPEPSGGQRFSVENGRLVPIPREQWVSVPYQDQVDALLFLGPTAERRVKPPPVSICSEPGYVERRLARMMLARLPPPELDRLKKLCAR
jgi:hypothetical protein